MQWIMIIGLKLVLMGGPYADVLPYFKRMETWNDAGHGGDPLWRGVKRSTACYAWKAEKTRYFLHL